MLSHEPFHGDVSRCSRLAVHVEIFDLECLLRIVDLFLLEKAHLGLVPKILFLAETKRWLLPPNLKRQQKSGLFGRKYGILIKRKARQLLLEEPLPAPGRHHHLIPLLASQMQGEGDGYIHKARREGRLRTPRLRECVWPFSRFIPQGRLGEKGTPSNRNTRAAFQQGGKRMERFTLHKKTLFDSLPITRPTACH